MYPQAGDVLHKWNRNFLVTGVNQGCVYVQPSLSAHKAWVGVLFFREWAVGAEVVHVEEVCASDEVPGEIVSGHAETGSITGLRRKGGRSDVAP